jgi:hypothetical protein
VQHLPEEWAEVYGKLQAHPEGVQQQQQQYVQSAAGPASTFNAQYMHQPEVHGLYAQQVHQQQVAYGLQDPYQQQHAQVYQQQLQYQQQQVGGGVLGAGLASVQQQQPQQQGIEHQYQQQLQPLGQLAGQAQAPTLVELPRSPEMGDVWEEI